MSQAEWDEMERHLIAALPDRLRERACLAGEPWTGDDPASNHGHTDCWYAHLAASEIERLRAALKQMDIGCTEAREFGPEFACTLFDTADDWCLACLAHAALADQGGES